MSDSEVEVSDMHIEDGNATVSSQAKGGKKVKAKASSNGAEVKSIKKKASPTKKRKGMNRNRTALMTLAHRSMMCSLFVSMNHCDFIIRCGWRGEASKEVKRGSCSCIINCLIR
jgi:hypothetical protein